MPSKYVDGAYASGYRLSGAYSGITIGASGSIGGAGLIGGVSASYRIVNLGRIAASAHPASGIELWSDGIIVNGSTSDESAYIAGAAGAAGAYKGPSQPSGRGGAGGAGIVQSGVGRISNQGVIVGGAGGVGSHGDGYPGGGSGGTGIRLSSGRIVHAGAGTDLLIGGAGGDVFYAGGKTTMTGSVGANEFVFSAAGHNTVTDFAASASNEIVFSNSGFDLGLTDASRRPKSLPASLFVADRTGQCTTTTQRFAYNVTTGRLFYDSDGSGTGASRELVATFDNQPNLALHNLFFVR